MQGKIVITADEMKRIEKMAIDAGEDERRFMENAGAGIARVVEPFAPEEITLLIGKGNKGGDAFTAGAILLKKGFAVKAYHLYPLGECSPLCQKMGSLFKGPIVAFTREATFEKGVIIDGILGTGFHGAASGIEAEAIERANHSELPIFAIDIPSGLNGSTGEVGTVAIQAHTTISLGLPKLGFFIGQGWNHIGNLVHVDFGLPQSAIDEANISAYLISESKAAAALPKMARDRHKYQSGYILAVAGSPGMPGAALMCSQAALKSGAGIVRLFYPKQMKEELVAAPYELIKEEWDLVDDHRLIEESKRAKVLMIGPGVGRSEESEKAVTNILQTTQLPCVIDADALFFMAKNKMMKLPEKAIITPHHQEMERILGTPPNFAKCQNFVEDKQITLLLKGGPTVIFHPGEAPLIIPRGDPGMAKAGTGDVLTGIIAAFVAQGLEMRDAAALGALLHAIAGEIAAEEETSYCVVATDLIRYLPDAIQVLKIIGDK
ncbi:MAG: NAD(P)H-hydrate dehydratase [Verrucomicrobia bacterium]|nr:NAD(P)H-hydrate dehydratase [Verrucomicrobiota bacterium]